MTEQHVQHRYTCTGRNAHFGILMRCLHEHRSHATSTESISWLSSTHDTHQIAASLPAHDRQATHIECTAHASALPFSTAQGRNVRGEVCQVSMFHKLQMACTQSRLPHSFGMSHQECHAWLHTQKPHMGCLPADADMQQLRLCMLPAMYCLLSANFQA